MSIKNLDLITKELRSLDYNSYLCATLSHKKDFPKLAAILLLHAQLRKISDITDEEMVGMIRLAWWKENLTDIFAKNKCAKHHLLEEINGFKDEIDAECLIKACEGFELDFIEDNRCQNKQQLDDYIAKTYEHFFHIMLQLLHHQDDHLAKHLAIISFYFELLKKIKQEDEKVVRFFYPDFFKELNIEAVSWQKNEDEDNLLVIVEYIVGQIRTSCAEIKNREKTLDKRLKNLVIKKDLIEIIIRDLVRNKYDIFATNLSANRLAIKIKLLFKL